MNGVLQIEMRRHRGLIVGIVIEVVVCRTPGWSGQYPQPNVRRGTSTAFSKRKCVADVPPVLSHEFMDFCGQVYIKKCKQRLSLEIVSTHDDGRYRVFANLERIARCFPRAVFRWCDARRNDLMIVSARVA
jgi:hypothetical protein